MAALEQWPESGVPNNPGAWLMAIAKRRAIDLIRRKETYQRKLAELGHDLEIDGESVEDDVEAILEDTIEDDLLRLVFTACHPVLTTDARVSLTLRLLGGLKTDEIARAFLAPEATIAQRIVRAKRNLAKADVQFEVPTGDDLIARLSSVLEVIYLIYNEGYSATAGDDWMRPALCNEALRLGRLLAELMPAEPEVHGLLALMEIQASRANARVGPNGEPVLLLDQDRRRWDRLLIRRGLESIDRAWAIEGTPGPYLLQAAIAACHARAAEAEDTDWARIAGLYAVLAQVTPSPVVEPQPGGRDLDGVRPRAWARRGGCAGRRTVAEGLPPAAERAGRSAVQAQAARRGARRVREGGRADPQRARTDPAARPRGGLLKVFCDRVDSGPGRPTQQ